MKKYIKNNLIPFLIGFVASDLFHSILNLIDSIVSKIAILMND